LKHLSSFLVIFFLFATPSFSQVIKLGGSWKFHIDDNSAWASPTFDDSGWESIMVPSTWEDEGFHGYDGFAWYRRKFDGRKLDKNESYYLNLGYIDDCNEVYLNGKLVGFSGHMPPYFKTAYNTERKYSIPPGIINFNGENTIAIRVYDAMHRGGITDGELGIYRWEANKHLLVSLDGLWSFAISDNDKPLKGEVEWRNIMVPGPWEQQGYKHDGFAWYKQTFTLPPEVDIQQLVLLIGRIDDFDKVYLNGVLIGSTNDHGRYTKSYSYLEDRVYEIPPFALKKKGINTLEILVEDIGGWGGIYEGVVGIASKSNYEKYFKR
jgi:Beta-galactosidase jelly roll domain